MRRKVRSWESMEKEYGLDKDGDIDPKSLISCFYAEMKHLCGKVIDIYASQFECWYIIEWMLEPLTPQIKEVSYDDLQDAEFSDGGVKWCKAKYICTHVDGSYRSASGSEWKYMRPVKTHDVEELKQLARLT